MEKMTGETLNITTENIKVIAEYFPEAMEEGKIKFDVLKELLGEFVDEENERYQFTWNGKSQALKLSQTSSTGTLLPCKEKSKDWDTTENLYIEGDNLEVLKSLQKAYYRKVKMIYIDPPYNTGSDFVYKDDFKNNIKNYKEQTNQECKANAEIQGRYHTDWLNMMYSRLRLAKNLLNDEGLIFISIDDNEVFNLKKICDEVFGENNFVGCAGRITKKSNNKGDFWAPNFDYILTYTKNIDTAEGFLGGINYNSYNLVEEDGQRKGEKYQLVRLYMSSLQNRNPEQRFWIECPDGSKIIPPGKTFPPERPVLGDGIWRWTRKKFEEEKDKIVIKKVNSSNLLNENMEPAKWNVFTKTYLNDVINNSSAKPNSFIEGYINQMSSHELNALDIPFDYAKPTALIKYLMEICKVNKNDIVLDFFSGSASTADAVMQMNAKDSGKRKFIMVQLPEKIDEKQDAYSRGYRTITEIGEERIRRAGNKIKEETNANIDYGFKVFKLDSSNLKLWNGEFDTEEEANNYFLEHLSPLVDGRTNEDLLYELLLKEGMPLTSPIEEIKIGDKTIYSIGMGYLMICLEDKIDMSLVEEIGKRTPEAIIFRDSGFSDENAKINTIQELKKYGIAEEVIKSI